jgi:hypothetical protein
LKRAAVQLELFDARRPRRLVDLAAECGFETANELRAHLHELIRQRALAVEAKRRWRGR